jgi:hypothetical protein
VLRAQPYPPPPATKSIVKVAKQQHISRPEPKSGGTRCIIKTNKHRGLNSASELYRLSDRLLSAKSSANFCGERGVAWSARRIPHGRQSQFSRPEPLLFLSSSSSFILMRLNGPRSGPTATQKIEPRTSVLAVRSSDHWTTEAVDLLGLVIELYSCLLNQMNSVHLYLEAGNYKITVFRNPGDFFSFWPP